MVWKGKLSVTKYSTTQSEWETEQSHVDRRK